VTSLDSSEASAIMLIHASMPGVERLAGDDAGVVDQHVEACR
jgi:hypothetical protein